MKNFFIIIGTTVISTISLVVIFSVAYFLIKFPELEVPKILVNWGGLIIGFYFGSFMGLVKDWISDVKEK